jgi:hypothetical protein
MPLGLPNHLAPHALALAYSRASHAVALVCLALSALSLVILQISEPGVSLWRAMLCVVPPAIAIHFLERFRAWPFAVAYLVVGAVSVYAFTIAIAPELPATARTDAFLLVLPQLAVLFIGAGSRWWRMIAWTATAFAVATVAVDFALERSGGTVEPSGTMIGALASIVIAIVIFSSNRRLAVAVQPDFTRAAREEQVASMRYRIEVKAAAIMHDTVLGHLATIATSEVGELPLELRRRMDRDLEVLVGEEWLLESNVPDEQTGTAWRGSQLFLAIDEVRGMGLEVDVTGDVSATTRLDAERARAVALAVKQCLVNVIRHAGVSRADVVIYDTDDDISVMVIDAGKGFTLQETGSDRLGLRQSVRRRIEQVGGVVRVWSTPGRGTSVMIVVPTRSTDAGLESSGQK